jgi:hypothetical protein
MTDTGLVTVAGQGFKYDLGTFEVGHFGEQSAMGRTLTAMEVVAWDHGPDGEAKFWPSGDHAGVSILCAGRSAVTGSALLALDRALSGLGGDATDNFLRIHHAVNTHGIALGEITAEKVDDIFLHIFRGTSFLDLRREAAYELFENYYPDAYRMWEATNCDGLSFDPEDFLDSPSWSVKEVRFGDEVFLLIVPQQAAAGADQGSGPLISRVSIAIGVASVRHHCSTPNWIDGASGRTRGFPAFARRGAKRRRNAAPGGTFHALAEERRSARDTLRDCGVPQGGPARWAGRRCAALSPRGRRGVSARS